jgi:hypothetical protein
LTLTLAAAFSGCLGCGGGGPYFQMRMSREVAEGQPVWVGVYLLTKEAALDGKEIRELTNKEAAKSLGPSDGVAEHYIQPVYPGSEPVELPKKEYAPEVTTVLIAANFPKPQECARQKIAVKKGEDIKVRVSIDDKCLKIHKKFD